MNLISLDQILISSFSEEDTVKKRLGHRVADWSEQVVLGVEDLNVSASNERSESILFVKILPCFRPIDIEPNVFFVVSWHILLLLY